VRVPLADLAAQHAAIRAEVMAAAMAVIERQEFILGEPVARFEATLAKIAGVPHAVGVASGTDALVLALRALGIGAGDTVVTTPLTFVATAEAILTAGAVPLFADVEPDTLTLDPASVDTQIARARARGASVKAILPVHLFGQCADMAGLGKVARAHRVVIVEDAAQAVGARDAAGASAGGAGECGCFSFFPSKNLGGWGDGGAVVTRDVEIAGRLRRLRAHGIVRTRAPSSVVIEEAIERGTNSRLDALQAAVLDAKAAHLESWTRARRERAAIYGERLAGLPLTLPTPRPGSLHVFHQFVVRTPQRDALAAHLAARGIETRAYYALPLHHHALFRPFAPLGGELPHADAAGRTLLAIPLFAELDEAAQAHVVESIQAFFPPAPPRPKRS